MGSNSEHQPCTPPSIFSLIYATCNSLLYATCNSLLPMVMPVFHRPCCPSYICWTAFPVSTADSARHQELITSHEVQERGLRSCTEATKPCILVQTCSCRWWHHSDILFMSYSISCLFLVIKTHILFHSIPISVILSLTCSS
jgi:hypothetical protein